MPTRKPNDPAAIEVRFREWWAQSYPTPPGIHAVNTHVGFGTWLLDQSAPDASLANRKQ